MNWICNSCGYENEYNDESQPTECLCCGEPATEDQLNLAKRELENFHKELDDQKRLERLRQKAQKRQRKIEQSVHIFTKSARSLAVACIVFVVFSFVFIGFNIYRGSVSLNNIAGNTKSISLMDNEMFPVHVMSNNLSHNHKEFIDNYSTSISYTAKGRRLALRENLKDLKEKNNKILAVLFSGIKEIGTGFQNRYENAKDINPIFQSSILQGFNNLTVNMDALWEQTKQNIDLLIDSITKKVGEFK